MPTTGMRKDRLTGRKATQRASPIAPPAETTQRELIRFYTSRLKDDWECEVERSPVIDITDAEHPRLEVCCYN